MSHEPTDDANKAACPPDTGLAEDVLQKTAQEEVESAPQVDPLAAEEENAYELQKQKLEIEALQKAQEERSELHGIRKEYVEKLFMLISVWLGFVVVLVFLVGYHCFDFNLSDRVLIALITSTTATVLGLFAVVAKWLYPTPSEGKRDKHKHEKADAVIRLTRNP